MCVQLYYIIYMAGQNPQTFALQSSLDKQEELLKAQGSGLPQTHFTEEENQLAYRRIVENYAYRGLDQYVIEPIAGLAEQYLNRGAGRLYDQTRGAVVNVLSHLLENPLSARFSFAKLCREANVPYATFLAVKQKWPYVWHFINLVLTHHTLTEASGRMVQVTTDAALTGNDRDRRLWYELFGGLRQKEQTGGQKLVVNFIVDNMSRPRPDGEVVDGEFTEDSL